MNVVGVGIDWGSTNIRAWLLAADGSPIHSEKRSAPSRDIADQNFEQIINELVAALGAGTDLPVMICGMIGAKDGWVEAPYVSCPTKLNHLIECATPTPRPRTWILPGISCLHPSPDVMRGEETQILGAMMNQPTNGQSLVCLPGTHSKWAKMRNGELLSFKTFATGELHALSVDKSIYAGLTAANPFDETAYCLGLETSEDRALLNHLFQVRSRVLVDDMSSKEAYWFLSGVLIGSEIRSIGSDVADLTLIADGELRRLYTLGCEKLLATPKIISAEEVTRTGLSAALCSIKDRP